MTMLLFLASLTAGPAALPAPADEQFARTTMVRFSDLDLSTTVGRATLDRRVKRAVKHVCELAGPTSPADIDRVSECREQALRDAARQVALAAGFSTDDAELWAAR